MKTLDRPKKEVSIDPLMYQEITKVINYMRSSASPSPIDQISIIMLKNCPITRTMLTNNNNILLGASVLSNQMEKRCYSLSLQKRFNIRFWKF